MSLPPSKWINGRRSAKLTPEQVAQIKRLALDGARTVDLAAQFGVSTSMIRMIKNGTSWGDIEPATEVPHPLRSDRWPS